MDTISFLEDQARREAPPGRPLRILQFCSARNGTYGAVASMLTLAEQLRSMGQTVDFTAFRGRGLAGLVRGRGFTSHEVAVRFKLDVLAAVSLARILRAGQYDVVHSHLSTSCLIGGWAGKFARVPSLASVHGLSGKLSFATSDHLLAVSEEVRRHLIAQGVRDEKVTVIHNGVPVSPLPTQADRDKARRVLGLPPDVRIVGTTARLTAAKGVHHALAAFAHVHDNLRKAQFVVFGDGPERAKLVALASHLGIEKNVKFPGYRADVRDLLPALDVFVFPSLKEAMGIAIVEAMLAGLPVVAHSIGGVPEVVKEGTGYLVPAGDERRMAEHLSDLLFEDDLRIPMGQRARDWAADEFNAEKMAARTVDAYVQAMNSAKRR